MSNFGPEQSIKRQIEIKRQEDDGTYRPEQLSAQELEALEKQMKALDIILKDQVKAKYKIEVQFGKNRTSSGRPFAGAMSLWLSGSKFHGGGDEKIFECPDDQCDGLILPEQITQRTIRYPNGKSEFTSISICHKCGRSWKSEDTVGERLLKLTDQDWAYAILKKMNRLEMNADVYLKYHWDDIRYKTMMEMARNRGGEEIGKARSNRGLHIYPLKNLIKDTKHGADLYGRIRAFINA